MPSTSNIRAATHPTEPESAITQRSERDQEVDAYIRGQITVDEFLNTMDRHGSWIELFYEPIGIQSSAYGTVLHEVVSACAVNSRIYANILSAS